MSQEYANKYGEGEPTTSEEMREHCQRPGDREEDGNIIYTTEQAHKDQCDINKIIARYDKTGLITHISKFEGRFGDLSGADFTEMAQQVAHAKSMFEELPSSIRNRFDNDPGKLLAFMDDEGNRDEAIELGMIREEWTEETDGLGEHVPDGGNIEKDPDRP